MLVLTRNVDQSIMIGDDIKVTLIGCSNGQARLAIHAPRHIAVDREEIRKRKLENPYPLDYVKDDTDTDPDTEANGNV